MRYALQIVAFLSFALLTFSTGQAAKITSTKNVNCRIKLSGTIERDDFKKFSGLAEVLNWTEKSRPVPSADTGDRTLCLNIPGGSYYDGRLIAGLIPYAGIATRYIFERSWIDFYLFQRRLGLNDFLMDPNENHLFSCAHRAHRFRKTDCLLLRFD